MKTIVTFGISKQQAMRLTFSLRNLYETRDEPDGPLKQLIDFFKSDAPRLFKMDNVRIGKKDDKYVISYYQEGIRYRIMKNGNITVESADDNADMSRYTNEMKKVIDHIIMTDITKRARNSMMKNDKLILSKSRELKNDDDMTTSIITAISLSD